MADFFPLRPPGGARLSAGAPRISISSVFFIVLFKLFMQVAHAGVVLCWFGPVVSDRWCGEWSHGRYEGVGGLRGCGSQGLCIGGC